MHFIISCYYCSYSSSRDQGSSIQVLRHILDFYDILGRRMKWIVTFYLVQICIRSANTRGVSGAPVAGGRTAREDRSDCQVLYGERSDRPCPQSDRLVRPSRSGLISSFFLATPSFAHPWKTHLLSFSLKVKRTLLVGRPCPSIPVQPRASPVSPRRPPPSPLGISSIPLLLPMDFVR
jgi:hypothetical protein